MNQLRHILALFLFLIAGHTFSQEVRVDAVLDTSKLRIGEQAKVDIYVTYNANQKDIKIQWPTIGDTLTGKIDVVSISPIDTTFPDKTNSTKIFQHQQILVSVYDSGFYALPPFKFILNNDSTHPLYTSPLFLEVHTVPTDTSATKLKDIKPPFDEKFNWRWYIDYIYWGSGILVFVLIIILLTIYFTRKQKQVILEPEKPKIPPHITALAALEKIRQEQIWKDGKVKEYYSAISETIRAYIEDRFNVNALESTTDEIMTAFRTQVVDMDSKDKLQQQLTLSDLVKFAKMFPIEDEHNFTLRNAFDFVNGTKREEEVVLPVLEKTQNETLQAVQNSNGKPVGSLIENTSTKQEDRKTLSPPLTGNVPGQKKSNRSKWIKIGVGIISFLITLFLLETFVFSSSFDDVIVEVANSMNKVCPIMVDNETRLDNVTAMPGKIMKYNYTLINVTAGKIDLKVFRSQVEPTIFNLVKTNPELKKLRDNQATLEYEYKDKDGKFLLSIKVTPADYNTYN